MYTHIEIPQQTTIDRLWIEKSMSLLRRSFIPYNVCNSVEMLCCFTNNLQSHAISMTQHL